MSGNARISGEAAAALAGFARIRRARRGEILLRQGDLLPDAVVMLEGTLRVFSLSAQGKEATLYHLREGEMCMLSLTAALTTARYPAWVSVDSPAARFGLVPGKALRELFGREAAVRDLVLGSLALTVRDLLVHIDEALLCSLGERILRFIHRNAAENGRLVVTHQMLAQHLGVTREAITRELRALKRQKAIIGGRGYIQLV